MHYTATYSPEDNKLRLYASGRLDAETYDRVRAAGFRWAPKQELFVAPQWTPSREDVLIELAGEIDDEDTSLVERAEAKAERLDDLAEKRTREARQAKAAVDRVADGIPFGQPILVGHHSERHARRDAEKIRNGMDRAVKLWDQAGYWTQRAAGALRLARYRERPDVRARRIKGLEADLRKLTRDQKEYTAKLAAWTAVQAETDPEKQKAMATRIANVCWLTLPKKEGDTDRIDSGPTAWGALTGDHPTLYVPRTVEEVVAYAIKVYSARTTRERWIAHTENRIAYERAMLEEAGATELLAPKPRAKLVPLLNYRAEGGSITTANPWDRNRSITFRQVEMTKAEYVKINKDYRGARVGPDRQHRFRTAMVKHELVSVFLTDSKEHPPGGTVPPPTPEPKPEPVFVPRAPRPVDPEEQEFEALRKAAKQGVQVVVANQLFPTPRNVAEQMADYAGLDTGQHVLEPSAGTGALIEAANSRASGLDLTAIEVNPRMAQALGARHPGVTVINADFMDAIPDPTNLYDAVLMNPPFERGTDIAHIIHARHFLRPGGRLVAICANGPRQRAELMADAEHWEDLPDGTFAPATNVRTALMVWRAPAA